MSWELERIYDYSKYKKKSLMTCLQVENECKAHISAYGWRDNYSCPRKNSALIPQQSAKFRTCRQPLFRQNVYRNMTVMQDYVMFDVPSTRKKNKKK